MTGNAAVDAEVTSRERVLRAAAYLFRTKGFDATSMREIAQLAGLGKSSLYHHVPSKQQMLGELVDHGMDQLTSALQRVATADLPTTERLRLAVRTHVLTYIEHRDSVACFIQEGRALTGDQRGAFFAHRDRYEGWFRELVADGIAKGEFRPTDVKLAVFAILGMCHWVVRWYRPDGGFPPEKIADDFAEFAVRGLVTGQEGG